MSLFLCRSLLNLVFRPPSATEERASRPGTYGITAQHSVRMVRKLMDL